MKSSLTLLVLVLLLVSILAGCAAGPNQFKGAATEHNVVAGFWLGLWQGFIAPSCSWSHCSKATSISTSSTTTELGTTSATCSASPASSVVAATVRRVGSDYDGKVLGKRHTGDLTVP